MTGQFVLRLARLFAMCVAPLSALAQTDGAAPKQVPEAWIAYAREASRELHDRVANADGPAATRLHRYLEDRGGSLSVVIRIWIEPDARIRDAAVTDFGNTQAEADLLSILAGGRLAAPPPPEMRQPLKLRLQIAPPKSAA